MARMIAETLLMIQRLLDEHEPEEQAQARAFVDARYPPLIHRPSTGADEPNEPVQNGSNAPVQTGSLHKSISSSFLQFWSEYPKKTGKKEALRIWTKLKPDQELTEKILVAVRQQKDSEDWTKDNGQFIPHPKTWLNQERWCDEPVQIGARRGSFSERLWAEAQREKRGEA